MIPLMNAAGWVKKPADVEPLLKIDPAILPSITLGSYTFDQRDGNHGNVFWNDGETNPSSLNALGLPNQGVLKSETFAEFRSMIRAIHESGKRVRISIAEFAPISYAALTDAISRYDPDEIEVNLGCPNIRVDGKQKPIISFSPLAIAQTLHEVSQHNYKNDSQEQIPLAVKLSPYSDPSIIPEIVEVIAQFTQVSKVVTSNTFPNGYAFDGDGKAAITANDGYAGLGGYAMKYIAIGQVRQLRKYLRPRIEVVGVGGVSCAQDVRDLVTAGATEVQIGTTFFLRGPKIFQEIAMDLVED